MTYSYPPGSMTGRGGPYDDGCPCANCPARSLSTCTCDLEELDDEGLGSLPDPICDLCECCRVHCHCYVGDDEDGVDAGEVAEEVELGGILDAMAPPRESGLGWDKRADVTPVPRHAPIRRAGRNYWVTRDLANPWPGEEGMYFDEQRWADQIPPKVCPNHHEAHFKPTVGTHVCRECGLIYIGETDQWIAPSR
jgi:hypothetical protein